MVLDDRVFLTHEVGSLRKPNPLIKASQNKVLRENDFEELRAFFQLIGQTEVPAELVDLLKRAGPERVNDVDYHHAINRWRVRLNVAYKESTGIDLVDAGEWVRREMYQHVIDNEVVSGIQLLSHIRSFDYNFWRPGICVGDISYDASRSIYVEEFEWAREFATKPLKVCLTSFNTVAEWTLRGRRDFDDLLFELVEEVFVPETIKLLKAGAKWLQFDEPALTTYPEHVESFVDAWNYFVAKIRGHLSSDVVLSIHNCFSDYTLLWPILPELDRLGALSLEFANRDGWSLGVTHESRPAYAEHAKTLKTLYETGFKARIALGVLPVHTDHETSPELIRDRLLYINKHIIEDPRLILAAPDCGLRQRSLPVAHKLLQNMVKGAELARHEIEG